MKTSVIDVSDMLSVLSVPGVEERIGEVPGVESVTVNHAAATATVRYDETRLRVGDIKSDVRQRGFAEAAAASAPTSTPTPTPSVESEPGGQAPVQQPPVPSAAKDAENMAPTAPEKDAAPSTPAATAPKDAGSGAPPEPAAPSAAAVPAEGPADTKAATGHEGHEGHDDHAAPDSPPSEAAPATPKATGKAPAAGADHHAHMAADFRNRFWISLALTLPILVLSPMLQALVGLREVIGFPGDVYVLFALASAVFWYGGWPFLKGFVEEVKTRRPGMMTLVAVAITTAYLYSSAVVFGLAGKMFFWELASLVDIML
ncbi:MAG: heavy metal translocating P-type ATPase, partial [Rubrivivax sp.]|nr:heavy metal translocating P-type ATPase [Rubrivivax sp.]